MVWRGRLGERRAAVKQRGGRGMERGEERSVSSLLKKVLTVKAAREKRQIYAQGTAQENCPPIPIEKKGEGFNTTSFFLINSGVQSLAVCE